MRIWLTIILLLWSFPVIAAPVFGPENPDHNQMPPRDSCWITQAVVNDPEPPLNLRTSPEALSDNIVQPLPNGTWLTILGENAGWLRVRVAGQPAPKELEGWVAGNRTEHGCNYFSETIGAWPVDVSDRIIGGGSHQYVVALTAGQLVSLRPAKAGNSPPAWPSAVMALDARQPVPNSPNSYTRWWTTPNDKKSSPPSEWRWQVERDGLYVIVYDSNFRGFSYGFSLSKISAATE